MKYLDTNGFLFIGGHSIKAQNTTLADMLVQSIGHVKKKMLQRCHLSTMTNVNCSLANPHENK